MKANASDVLRSMSIVKGDWHDMTANVLEDAEQFPRARDIFFALVRACEDCRDYASGDTQHRDNLAREMYAYAGIYDTPARARMIATDYANATNPVF